MQKQRKCGRTDVRERPASAAGAAALHCSPAVARWLCVLSFSAALAAQEEVEGLVFEEALPAAAAATHSTTERTFETTCNESRVSGEKR